MIDANPADVILAIIIFLEPLLVGGLLYCLFSKLNTNSKPIYKQIPPPPKPKYYGKTDV